MTLNPNLKNFWFKEDNKLARSRYKVLYGGRSSSKSHDIARMLVYIAYNSKKLILCLRMFQVRLSDSVYSLIENIINEAGIQSAFKFTKSSIVCTKTGSEFLFYGIARNTNQLKGLEGVDIAFIEEAEDLTEEAFKIITPTIRKQNSEIIIAFNPRLKTDFVYDYFVENTPSNARVRHINYLENPYLSDTMRADIELFKEQDEESYNHIYLGEPLLNDDNAIIKYSWIIACIGAKRKLEEMGFSFNNSEAKIGYDVADSGTDTNAYCVKRGMEVVDLVEWHGEEDELMKSSKKVHNRAIIENAVVYYDSIGVGAGVGSNFKEINQTLKNKVNYYKFKASAPALKPNAFYRVGVMTTKDRNKDYFENLKAQAWYTLADKMKATYRAVNGSTTEAPSDLISIDEELPLLKNLIKELTAPMKVRSMNSKNAVEKKKDMLKRGIKSPNLADAFVMCFVDLHSGWVN